MPSFSRRADDNNIMAIQKTTTSRNVSSSVHSSTSKTAPTTTTTTKPSKPTKAEAGGKTGGGKFGLGGLFHKVADWASTSEPSMQALNQYKQEAFQRAGVSPNNAEAHTKLHAPIGEIPEDAIRPTTGPTPEEVLMRKKAERKRRQMEEEQRRGSIGGSSNTSGGGRGGSVRSGSVSSSTMSGGLHGLGFHGTGTGTETASSTVGSVSSRKGSVSGGSSAVPWDTSGW